MSHTRTDDEIAELFASANPVPNDAPARGPVTRRPVTLPADGRVAVDVGDRVVEPVDGRHRERWWVMAGVAAAVALVVSLAVASTRDTGDPAPADEPPTETVPAEEPEPPATTVPATEDAVADSDDVDIAERFIAAINDRDLAAIVNLSTDDLKINEAGFDELPWDLQWDAAFDRRLEGGSCEIVTASNSQVVCRNLSYRDRLTDLTGVERTSDLYFRFNDGEVEWVGITEGGQSEWWNRGFQPFFLWVQSNHPDDVERMWTFDGGRAPIMSAESIALFDQHLTEYVASETTASDDSVPTPTDGT